jgi:hypothetical protein
MSFRKSLLSPGPGCHTGDGDILCVLEGIIEGEALSYVYYLSGETLDPQ